MYRAAEVSEVGPRARCLNLGLDAARLIYPLLSTVFDTLMID